MERRSGEEMFEEELGERKACSAAGISKEVEVVQVVESEACRLRRLKQTVLCLP